MRGLLRQRRHRRIRAKVRGTAVRPRVNVFRSLRGMHVQIINDELGVTLLAVSNEAASKKTKTEQASVLGGAVAVAAAAAGITKVVFDRGGYAYHGRVAALAAGMRAGGLEF